MRFLRVHPPSASLIVSIIALVVALSGTAIAAGLVSGDSLIKKNSLSGNRLRTHSVTGKQINLAKLGKVPSAAHADSATSASHATSADSATNAVHAQTADSATAAASASNSTDLGGKPASSYQQFGSTLPSGQSESGDYGIRVPTTATGSLDLSVSFPIPLATDITNVVYTAVGTPVTHCSGPGNADPGYLCIYHDVTQSVGYPAVTEFEDKSFSGGTGHYGFNMQWPVSGADPFSIGTWTVTAP